MTRYPFTVVLILDVERGGPTSTRWGRLEIPVSAPDRSTAMVLAGVQYADSVPEPRQLVRAVECIHLPGEPEEDMT